MKPQIPQTQGGLGMYFLNRSLKYKDSEESTEEITPNHNH